MKPIDFEDLQSKAFDALNAFDQEEEMKENIKKGVTIFINRIGYYFEDTEELIELLDINCNDAIEMKCDVNSVIFD